MRKILLVAAAFGLGLIATEAHAGGFKKFDCAIPKLECKKISLPKCELPKFECKKIALPKCELPKFECKKIALPKIGCCDKGVGPVVYDAPAGPIWATPSPQFAAPQASVQH
ncbi:MAG: hypothetical protein U0800_14385 [Isosphaeraceae bacterium]